MGTSSHKKGAGSKTKKVWKKLFKKDSCRDQNNLDIPLLVSDSASSSNSDLLVESDEAETAIDDGNRPLYSETHDGDVLNEDLLRRNVSMNSNREHILPEITTESKKKKKKKWKVVKRRVWRACKASWKLIAQGLVVYSQMPIVPPMSAPMTTRNTFRP